MFFAVISISLTPEVTTLKKSHQIYGKEKSHSRYYGWMGTGAGSCR
jgi:hypothetical protein